LETAAILVIEQGGKYSRRIELGVAEEIDRTIHPD